MPVKRRTAARQGTHNLGAWDTARRPALAYCK